MAPASDAATPAPFVPATRGGDQAVAARYGLIA